MLLIFLSVVLLAGGVLASTLYVNNFDGFWNHPVWSVLGALLSLLGVIGLFASAVFGLRVLINKDVDYQAALNERETLMYRLEHKEENLVGNEMLYSEITDFNNSLLITKKWVDSPWIGCFVNEKIAGLDYIQYKEG